MKKINLNTLVALMLLFYGCKLQNNNIQKVECGSKTTSIVKNKKNKLSIDYDSIYVSMQFWRNDFEVFVDGNSVFKQIVEEKLMDNSYGFSFSPKGKGTILIEIENGDCIEFPIDIKYPIYEVYKMDNSYRVNMQFNFSTP